VSDPATSEQFVGRGGLKLAHALDTFDICVTGLDSADLGCNIEGFTDCLLKRGARHVYAVDTGYGVLDYRLRMDERVTVMERTNALHAEPPADGVDLVTVDLAWTPQMRAIPSALRWLRAEGQIITLIKPHYEAGHGPERDTLQKGILMEADAQRVLERVLAELANSGVEIAGVTQSPILGGAGKKKGKAKGNIEFLALLRVPTGGICASGHG